MKIIGILTTILFALFFYAFTLSAHWEWFIVPLGAPQIGLAHAYGITLTLKLIIHRADLQTRDQSIVESILGSFILCLVFLFIGWVAHMIMIS